MATTKTKICVVGLLPNQANIIKQEYDIDCIEVDDQRKIQAFNGFVIVMTKFVNHNVKADAYCTGGLSTLRKLLDTL